MYGAIYWRSLYWPRKVIITNEYFFRRLCSLRTKNAAMMLAFILLWSVSLVSVTPKISFTPIADRIVEIWNIIYSRNVIYCSCWMMDTLCSKHFSQQYCLLELTNIRILVRHTFVISFIKIWCYFQHLYNSMGALVNLNLITFVNSTLLYLKYCVCNILLSPQIKQQVLNSSILKRSNNWIFYCIYLQLLHLLLN